MAQPFLLHIALLSTLCFADDPSVFYDFKLSYITVSPLGVPQRVIAVNGAFPGSVVNATTNYNVVVNVHNQLDENLLMTWSSNAEKLVAGRCSRASGGFGPIVINNRAIIDIPFARPDGDIVFLVGDWYTKNHTVKLRMPDGVFINGKEPYRYNSTLVPDGNEYETINVGPGKTYRFRVHNVGISTSLNFRIEGHNLVLEGTEGRYMMQQNFTSFDIHVGEVIFVFSYHGSECNKNYYIAASARFVNELMWERVTGVAVLHYSNSKGPATGPLPAASSDVYSQWSSMNQPRAIRQNTTASRARPNPQGSFHYGSINVTETLVIRSLPPIRINGKLRAALNGISFVKPDTPIRLADLHNVKGAYKLDFPNKTNERTPKMDRSIINATYRGFIEVILQNNDTKIQSFHLDGYSFFVVGMDFGEWTQNRRSNYNKWDSISRCTTEVYPGGWTAVFVSLDNVGVRNLRVENLDRWYQGQETYMRIINPEENGKTEMAPPDNVQYCGALQSLQKESASSAAMALHCDNSKLLINLVRTILPFIYSFR
ncbi:Monocopper oxidase-like protein SKS2 [Hibiscus syriacus]|uniref:Monocopper oxidase-like protein SKS2 n=1 Tax=Hibiscus syriacus TaxID=106335 RepID=A0A6A2ZRH7_HIBSY|nr:Monocopper oxidase-like protein SKS2 [Hibiscus syriacus]